MLCPYEWCGGVPRFEAAAQEVPADILDDTASASEDDTSLCAHWASTTRAVDDDDLESGATPAPTLSSQGGSELIDALRKASDGKPSRSGQCVNLPSVPEDKCASKKFVVLLVGGGAERLASILRSTDAATPIWQTADLRWSFKALDGAPLCVEFRHVERFSTPLPRPSCLHEARAWLYIFLAGAEQAMVTQGGDAEDDDGAECGHTPSMGVAELRRRAREALHARNSLGLVVERACSSDSGPRGAPRSRSPSAAPPPLHVALLSSAAPARPSATVQLFTALRGACRRSTEVGLAGVISDLSKLSDQRRAERLLHVVDFADSTSLVACIVERVLEMAAHDLEMAATEGP